MQRPPGEPEAGGLEANQNQQDAEPVVLSPEWDQLLQRGLGHKFLRLCRVQEGSLQGEGWLCR